MHPKYHVISSLGLSVFIYFFTKSFLNSLAAILAGVFIDLDHFFDYIYNYGFKRVKLKEFIRIFQKGEAKKLYIPIHSFEILILMYISLVWVKAEWWMAIIAGVTLHMGMDYLYNLLYWRFNPKFLFIFFRLRNHFERDALIKNK